MIFWVPNAAVVRLRWRAIGMAEPGDVFQVFKLRDDKIREIDGYRTEREALKAAG